MCKIVHIMLAGPVTDGWTYQDNLLTKYHRKLGYEVTMITSQWVWGENGKLKKFEKTDYINENDVKVIRLPINGRDNFYRKFKRFYGLYEAIEGEEPNVLFIHGVSFYDIKTVVKYIRSQTDISVYVDNHSDFSNSGTNWLSRNVLHKIIWKHNAQMLLPYTKKFYGVLPARVDWLVDMYELPKDKCELLVMGADDEEVSRVKKSDVRFKIRKEYAISDNEILLLAGGKIDNNKKEIITLMRAFSKTNLPNTKLMIFGSISPNLKEEFAKALGNSIIYVGWIDSKQIYEYLESSDIVAFPGLHSVLWEQAVGMGKACIFRKISGFDHVDLGGNCAYFESVAIEQIMNPIIHCIENNTWKNMQNIAEQRGMSYFSYEKIARRCINELEEN